MNTVTAMWPWPALVALAISLVLFVWGMNLRKARLLKEYRAARAKDTQATGSSYVHTDALIHSLADLEDRLKNLADNPKIARTDTIYGILKGHLGRCSSCRAKHANFENAE